MQKITQYMLNPPCNSIPATHYCTVAGDVMEYLFLNGDWFVKTFGWQYMQHEPVHCTPVGQEEIPREQVATPKVGYYAPRVDSPIYTNSRWKGD